MSFASADIPRLGFLVYASRSGSTFLARLLQERVAGLAVTAELKFDGLLDCSPQALRSLTPGELLDQLTRRDRLRNLGVESSVLGRIVAASERSHERLIRTLVDEHLGARGHSPPLVAVIKQGVHAFHWRRIVDEVPGAFLILIRRDPRAVVSSKLKTPRPYYPGETMGWAGAALNAHHWCNYERAAVAAAEAGMPVLGLRYEDLVSSTETELAKVADWLDLPLRNEVAAEQRYRVPGPERGIHAAVHEEAQTARVAGWQSEMSARQIAEVECVASRWMASNGYGLTKRRPILERVVRLIVAMPDAAARGLRHIWLHRAAK